MPKSVVDHPLYFSPREQRGIVVLLLICVLLHVLPVVYGKFYQPDVIPPDTAFFQKLAQQQEVESSTAIVYFEFDPNTIDLDTWQRLGIDEKSASTILNYVNKGGKFYKGEDLYKIYSLKKEKVDALLPYVKIENRTIQPAPKQFVKPERKILQRKIVDINKADEAGFESLPGIGPVLAKRIVTFREKLGGFYAVEQISEVYGIADSVYQLIEPLLQFTKSEIRQLNLNVATENELKVHPYIGYKKAKAIVNYREQHGMFTTWDDVLKIMIMTETDKRKLLSYIRFD